MATHAKRALALLMASVGIVVLPGTSAVAEDPPDTTAPQIDLNPCHTEVTRCRLAYAQIFGDLQPDDDLAVLGARLGDQVLDEHVYDDGTGFVPHGQFFTYGGDITWSFDYGLSVAVPLGTSEITFYARDLEGNTSELTATVLGPVPPGPVRQLAADLVGRRTARVSWVNPNLKVSCCPQFRIRSPGRPARELFTAPPYVQPDYVSYRRLSPGWHRFTVEATTEGGTGPSRTVRLFVPRPRHPRS